MYPNDLLLFTFLIGYKVSDTLRKVLIDVNAYQGAEKQLIFGYLSSLGQYHTKLKFILMVGVNNTYIYIYFISMAFSAK